jgi:uncharacterized membrane protein
MIRKTGLASRAIIDRTQPRDRRSAPEVLICIATAVALLGAIYREITGTPTIAYIGSFNFTAFDPLFVTAWIAAIYALAVRGFRASIVSPIAIVIAVLLSLSFLRGFFVTRSESFIWLRSSGVFAPILLMSIASTSRDRQIASLLSMVRYASIVISCLAIARYLTSPTLFMTIDVSVEDANDGGRVLANSGAMIVVAGLAVSVSSLFRSRFRPGSSIWIQVALFLAAVIISQQGTAIIAAIVVVFVLSLLERPRGVRSLVFAVGVVLAIIVAATATGGKLEPSNIFGENTARREYNLQVRRQIWQAAQNAIESRSGFDQAIGAPGGFRENILVKLGTNTVLWNFSFHSMYIATWADIGWIGLTAYVGLLFTIAVLSLMRTFRNHSEGSASAALQFALVLAAALESYSYELRQEGLLLLMIPLMSELIKKSNGSVTE